MYGFCCLFYGAHVARLLWLIMTKNLFLGEIDDLYIYMKTVHELCLLEQNQVISFYTLLKLFSSFLDLFSSNYLVRDPCFCVFYSTLPRTVEGIAFSEKYSAFSFRNCGTYSNLWCTDQFLVLITLNSMIGHLIFDEHID